MAAIVRQRASPGSPDNASMAGSCGSVRGIGTMVAAALALALWACSPTLNWRENIAEGTGLTTMFPCRPDRHARSLDLAGAQVHMQMLVCSAGDATYAVSFFDASDAAAVGPALAKLQAAMMANIGSPAPCARRGPAAAVGSAQRRRKPARRSAASTRGCIFRQRPARLPGRRRRHCPERGSGRPLLHRVALVRLGLLRRCPHPSFQCSCRLREPPTRCMRKKRVIMLWYLRRHGGDRLGKPFQCVEFENRFPSCQD